MKRLILVMALTFGSAFASEEKFCQDLSDVAYQIMDLRQSGVPIQTLYKGAKGFKPVEKIVIDAFEVPIFEHRKYRDKMVRMFADSVNRKCLIEFYRANHE